MPWPWEMGQYCLDNWSGGFKHWPWPGEDWLYNYPILRAITTVHSAHALFSKPATQWTPEDDKFYIAIMESAEE